MPWVRFTGPFYFTPPGVSGRVTIRYGAGETLLVTTPCAHAAVAAGKAEKTPRPARTVEKAAEAGGERHAIRPAP